MVEQRATATAVALAVIAQVRPLIALLAVLTGAAATWWAVSGDPVPVRMFAGLSVVATLGLAGSFVVHETGHLLALRRTPTVETVVLERTVWRLSLHPQGTMSPWHTTRAAVAGPAACAGVAAALFVLTPDSIVGSFLAWIYLAHLLALLPPAGDGRAVVAAYRTTVRRA